MQTSVHELLRNSRLAILSILWLQGCTTLVTTIPPQTSTDLTLDALERELSQFYEARGEFPAALDELPGVKRASVAVIDGWGHPIVFHHSGDGTVSVQSFGRDGTQGGDGEDSDHQITVDAEAIDLMTAARGVGQGSP